MNLNKKMDLQSSIATCKNPNLYQAIQNNKLEEIKFLLDNETDVNAPLWKTGSFAGYTALHLACMENKDDIVKLLVSDYKANINLVADDGTQPIHLACFYEPYTDEDIFYTNSDKSDTLLKAGANPDAEFGREIFTKHVKDQQWCPDFEKMTPLIYTIVYKKPDLAFYLIEKSCNLKMKSLKNKTLLMYALEYNLLDGAADLISAIEDPAYMNLKDDDGIPTIHHIFHPKRYNQFRYDSLEKKQKSRYKKITMMKLIEAGADKDALINGDPDTFLPNVAAYRSCSAGLKGLLGFYKFMPHSKVLYNATLPIDDNLDKIMRLHPNDQPDKYPKLMECVRKERQKTIEVALKDLVIRRALDLRINEEEILLLERLIATDEEIKNFVDNFEGKFINEALKSNFIEVNNKKICVLDFLKQVFDDRKLKLWAGDKTTRNWSRDVQHSCNFIDYLWLSELCDWRVRNGLRRYKLLKELDETSTLRKFIDLPYEIILEFIKYLNNEDLNAFIDALTFY